jgi:hypothetical protein
VGALGEEGPDPAERRELRRVLYGLGAILRLHFAQEEELYEVMGDAEPLREDSAASRPVRLR